MALNRMGQDNLASFPETTTKNGKVISGSVYNQTAKEVLRMLPWPCAIVRESVQSVANAITTDGGFAYKSSLPATCIRVLDINGDKANSFRIEGTTLYHTSSTAIILRYVKFLAAEDDETYPDPSTWDPILTEAIIARLASKVSHLITGQYQIAQALYQEYIVALAAAKSIIVSETKEDVADIMAFWTDMQYVVAKPRNEASE
jgi:hypothetical protein